MAEEGVSLISASIRQNGPQLSAAGVACSSADATLLPAENQP